MAHTVVQAYTNWWKNRTSMTQRLFYFTRLLFSLVSLSQGILQPTGLKQCKLRSTVVIASNEVVYEQLYIQLVQFIGVR